MAEGVRRFSELLEVHERQELQLAGLRGHLLFRGFDCGQLRDSSDWKRIQNKGIDDGENRCIGADAQRQSQCRNGCKARTLAQRSGGITQILQEIENPLSRARSFCRWGIAADDFFRDLQFGQEVGGVKLTYDRAKSLLIGGAARAQLTVLVLEMSGELVDDFSLA